MSNTARKYRSRDPDLRALRDEGCTCRPDIADIPAWAWPPGAIAGGLVTHQHGCVLGDRVAKLNATGVVPSFFHHTKRGCQR